MTKPLFDAFRGLERSDTSGGLLGISIRVDGRPFSITRYQEAKLAQQLVCERCTLRYAIYGVFGFCPDCGVHNSLQILEANLGIAEKFLVLAAEAASEDVGRQLRETALQNAVASFDGFGRECCRAHSNRATTPAKVESLSFQNLTGARTNVEALFGFDFASAVSTEEWTRLVLLSLRRHLLAHTAGVIDAQYVAKTGEPRSLIGTRIVVSDADVRELCSGLRRIGCGLFTALT